ATKQTGFENCVADVNIPVGEVFTSPVLKGTNGILNVSECYLFGLNYIDLTFEFKDGMVCDYSCKNFESEEENRNYIRENILHNHETLPIGEFAIGTNTTAYRMARDYNIEQKLPILIGEKTGPHFALGDTCYSHEEDVKVYNPDGKEIICRDNEVTAKFRKSNPSKAYFNCHTDITIPYDELAGIYAVREDGSEVAIIEDGLFVLDGVEELNTPLFMEKNRK
ncbi:MAG: aminopeptidase, partial [Lachnospiraceae bacterium]|nr:aminopeptidase [Lachnospiraceae bacterium]